MAQPETVLITGSSKGLGAELALVFAGHGYDIILHGRDKNDLAAVEQKVLALGAGCSVISGDIRQDGTIAALSGLAREKEASILINNAGTDLKLKDAGPDLKLPLEEIDDGQIDETLATNLIAPIKLTKRLYPVFRQRGGGTVININSLSGIEAHRQRTIYCASKWGLKGFTESFRLETENAGIRILSVYPSRIRTKPFFTYGMEPREVAQKIYAAYTDKNVKELILDDRPPR